MFDMRMFAHQLPQSMLRPSRVWNFACGYFFRSVSSAPCLSSFSKLISPLWKNLRKGLMHSETGFPAATSALTTFANARAPLSVHHMSRK